MGLRWTIDQVASCPSTNVELVRRARAGEVTPPYALIALEQTAGLGRNGRRWVTPARGAITMSALVRPVIPADKLGLFPLFAALAVCRVLNRAGFPAVAKWPNDVLLPAATPAEGFGNYRKVGGILCQAVPEAGLVVGIGINVSQTAEELPVPTATSLALYGPVPDSAALRVSILEELSNVLEQWENGGENELRAEFEKHCITMGQQVSVQHDDAAPAITGTGCHIADDGGLVISTSDGEKTTIHAGDVWLRAAS